MSIVHQTDKRSGITYAYESIAHWDKEKKQSRAKRTLIGRVDPKTGDIIPTDGRCRLAAARKLESKDFVSIPQSARFFYGATYLLDEIGDSLGITVDLKKCFPHLYQQILSLAYYLILEDKTPLYRFEKWGDLHKHPYGQTITSQRASDIFASIPEDAKNKFFHLQGQRRLENEYWVYDTTTISSYSECLRQIQYGHSKEDISLPQLNLALVFGEESNLPFYYRKLPGNIPDNKTLRHLFETLDILDLKKVKLVMDRGFYSEDNVNELFKRHLKFLMGAKMSLSFFRTHLDNIYDNFRGFEHFNDTYELYYHTVMATWSYKQHRPNKKDTLCESRRLYIHYYYNIDQAAEDEKAFDRKIASLRRELLSNKRQPENQKLYAQYFDVKKTPRKGIQVTVKEEAIRSAKRYYGFFALITNDTMDAITALEIYRNKDVVEKAFGDLKERLNVRRTLVSSEKSLDGKLFVEFVALIFLSHIKKKMQETGLFKTYTLQGLLDKLDVIERFEAPKHRPYIGEILEKQKNIYKALGVPIPTSL